MSFDWLPHFSTIRELFPALVGAAGGGMIGGPPGIVAGYAAGAAWEGGKGWHAGQGMTHRLSYRPTPG